MLSVGCFRICVGAIMSVLTTHGMWSGDESKGYITVHELKAVLFGIQSLCSGPHYCLIKIEIDNTTAVFYINHIDEIHSFAFNAATRKLFLILCCKARSICLLACHIRPFILNGL